MRGKNVEQALSWLTTCALKKRVSGAKSYRICCCKCAAERGRAFDLVIHKLYIDQGPIRQYFRPGAMGRANIQRSRKSHINVELAALEK